MGRCKTIRGMNILALAAGILTLIAFGAHAVVGTREYRAVDPGRTPGPARTAWVQALCGWHWVSFDLLATGVLFVLIGLAEVVPDEASVLLILSVYFAACGLVWLGTLIVSGAAVERRYLVLGQWMLCFVVAGLAFFAR